MATFTPSKSLLEVEVPNYSMSTIMRTHRVVKELMALSLVGRQDLNVGKVLAALETWREQADIFANDLYIEQLKVDYGSGGVLVVKASWRLGIRLHPYSSTIVVTRQGELVKSLSLDEEYADNSDLQADEDVIDPDNDE